MSKHRLVFKFITLITLQIFVFSTSASAYPTLTSLSKVKKELRVPATGENPEELVESLGGNSEVTSLVRKVNKLSRIKNGIIAGTGLPDIHGRIFESDSQFFTAEGNFTSELEQFMNTLSDKSVQETIHTGIMYYDIRSKFWKDNPAFTVAFALAFAKKIQQKTGKKDGIILHLGVDAYHKHFQTAQIFADAILRTGICDNGGGIYYWGVINGGDMRNYGQLYEALNGEGANWVYFTMSHKTDDFLGAKMGINAQVFSGSEVRHCEGVTSDTLYDAIVEKDFVEIKHKEPVGDIVNIENFLANNIQVAADMIRSTSARAKKDIPINELLKGARLYVDMGGNPIGKNLVDILKALGADVEIGNAALEINYSIEHIIDPNEHRSPAVQRLRKIAEETGRVVLAVDPDGDRGSIVALTSEGTALSMSGSELLLLTIENLSQNYHAQGKIATIICDMRTGTSAVDLEKIFNNRAVPVKVIPQEAGYPFFMRGMASLPADVAVENTTHAFTNPMTNKNWGAPQDYKRPDGKGYQGGDNAALFLIYLLGCMVHQWEGRNPVEQLEWVRETYDLKQTFVDERKPKLPVNDDKFKYMIADRMKVLADEWFKDDEQFLINFGNSLDAVMSGVHITKAKTGAMMLVRFSNTGASFTISGEAYSQEELNEMLGLGHLLLTTAVEDLHSGGHKFGFDVADAADLKGIFKLPAGAEKEKRYALEKHNLAESQQKFWDKKAEGVGGELIDENFTRTVLSEIPKNSKILTLGEGASTVIIAPILLRNHKVTATDFSSKALELLEAEAKEKGLKNLTLKQLDFNQEFGLEGGFNAVISHFALGMYSEDEEFIETLNRVKEVLKKDKESRLIFQVRSTDDYLYGKGKNIAPDTFVTKDIIIGGDHIRRFWKEAALRDILDKAGFKIERINSYKQQIYTFRDKFSFFTVVASLKEAESTQEFIQDLAKTAEILGVKSSTLLSLMQEGVRPEVFVEKLSELAGIGQAKAALGAEKAFQAILSRYELGKLKSEGEAVKNPVPWEVPLLTQEAARDYAVETSIKGIEFGLPEGDIVDKEKLRELKRYHQGIVELTMHKEKTGEFSHRGNVKEYIKHFKKDVVPELKGFINDNFDADWRKVKYVVLSGIGGNEMSNHNLAAIQRKLVKEGKVKSGIEFYVLSNPAEIVRLPAEADGNNTIFMHMSRSGETGETIKTLEFLREKFPKCIICANKGPLQQLAEKFNLFNLPFGEDEVKIGGRMMRRKTITGYAALWLSLGGEEKYFDEYVEEADKCDNLLSFINGEESLAVQMGEFLHSVAVLSGRPRLILMLNDDMTDERFAGEKQFLKHSLYELVQLWSEGYGKEDNYAPLEFINYSQDKEVLSGVMAQDDSCCGLVVLDRKNTNYSEAKKQTKAMASVMPLVIIETEGMDFKTAAALSSLYEDVITFMCTCENVDINANPGVKAVREESGRVLAGEEGKEAGEETAAKQIGEISTIGEVKADASLLAFAGQIEKVAKSLKIDKAELLKIYQDSLDNYNLFLNILEKAGGMAYQRAVALLEANDSFDYVVKGYKDVRIERQAEKEREVPGQVRKLVKEIQKNAGKYNISLELGAVKVDEEWLGERRKLHRGLREGDKDVLAQELAEFMDIAINTPDSKIGDIATVVSDIFQQDLGNKFKHSWMNSVAAAQDVFNELHIFTRASHHTFETILDNPEGYFFFGLVAQKQEAPKDRQDLKWLFEKVLEKDDVENPKHAGLNVGEMNHRLAKANYTSLWRKGLAGLSIEFEKLTTEEEEKLGELFEKTAKHYRNILKEAELMRFAKVFPYINVKLNKEKLTEPMAFIIDPALIGDNPSIVLAIQNLKEQLGDKIKIVFQHSKKSEELGAEALYETIKEVTDGAVDLKGKVDLEVPAKDSPKRIVELVRTEFKEVKSIRVIGRQEWTKGFEDIERPGLEKVTLVVCKIGEGSESAQGDLALLLALKDTGVLAEKEMIELNRRWGKGGNFFIVGTKKISEIAEIEKYREALKEFN